MDDREFLIALFDHDFGEILGSSELPAFSEWLKAHLGLVPGFLFGFELGNGKRAYAHYVFGQPRALRNSEIGDYFELGMPVLYLPQVAASTVPSALAELPCWTMGQGDSIARRFQ